MTYQRPNWQSLGNSIVCEEPQQRRMFAVVINLFSGEGIDQNSKPDHKSYRGKRSGRSVRRKPRRERRASPSFFSAAANIAGQAAAARRHLPLPLSQAKPLV
ncbi:unnamed protein product [Musa acuminata subsp. burmannicoides]